MNSILVVCEGNICRSPMAEGLLKAALPNVRVASAGLGALIGMPADPIAVRLMGEHGVDISKHRATQINRQICLHSDLVLVMEQVQRERLESLFPHVRGRVFRLVEHLQQDVPDPYRQPEQAFRDTLLRIEEGVQEWLHRIQRI